MDVRNRTLRILCSNGHLGFAPIKTESFYIGVDSKPDMLAADSGSCDIGPVPLASDSSSSPLAWQTHDLEHMLLSARKLGVPMIIGSAGDTGANSRVDLYVRIIQELAAKHGLPKFRLGYFYSEVGKDYLTAKMKAGEAIEGLDGRSDLTAADLDATDKIVGMAGVDPFIKLLDDGADVIIGGRCSDSAIFAAPAIRNGYPEALAYYFGKMLECSSFCAEPYAGKETVVGEISENDVRVTPMLPSQRCTIASVAGHAMYERTNPFFEYVAGGRLDMRNCVYEEVDDRTTRVTGPIFERSPEIRVKLEGAGRIGARCVGLVGVRDPYTIANIDTVLDWSRRHVREAYGNGTHQVHYNVFGRDGIMGELEPLRHKPGHELCIVVQGVAPTPEQAEELCMTAVRQLFYARLPEVKGTAGGCAFMFDEVMHTKPACRWTMNHTVRVDHGLELFPTHLVTAGR